MNEKRYFEKCNFWGLLDCITFEFSENGKSWNNTIMFFKNAQKRPFLEHLEQFWNKKKRIKKPKN